MPAGILLTLAIASEVCATLLLRVSDGFTRPLPAVGVVLGYVVSFVLLGVLVTKMDLGLVYAIWAGAGTAIVAVAGVLIWAEPLGALKLVSLAAVVAGVVGLNLSGAH